MDVTTSGEHPTGPTSVPFSASALRAFGVALLCAAGAGTDDATTMVDSLVAAEEYGHSGHGFSRLPQYVKRLRAGGMRSAPPTLVREFGAIEVYDGQDGFGHAHLRFAAHRAASLAGAHGIGAVGVSRSNHAGALGLCAREVAASGTIVLLASNAPAVLAPPGGTTPVVGTNAFALAAPVPDGDPVVCDGGMSQASRGLILRALQDGRTIPLGWAFDGDGNPTTDPAAGLAGTLAPLGGAKGFALAVLVEVLTGVLLGPSVGPQIGDFFGDGLDVPQGISHLALALAPGRFGDEAGYEQRMRTLREAILSSGAAPGATRVPGSRSRNGTHDRQLQLASTLVRELDDLAAEVGAPALAAPEETVASVADR